MPTDGRQTHTVRSAHRRFDATMLALAGYRGTDRADLVTERDGHRWARSPALGSVPVDQVAARPLVVREGGRRTRPPGRRARLSISVITRAALFAGAHDDRDLAFIRRMVASMTEHAVDRQIAEEAGRLRAEAGIRLPDALIAATALVHSLTLHTRNVRGFRRFPALRLRATR